MAAFPSSAELVAQSCLALGALATNGHSEAITFGGGTEALVRVLRSVLPASESAELECEASSLTAVAAKKATAAWDVDEHRRIAEHAMRALRRVSFCAESVRTAARVGGSSVVLAAAAAFADNDGLQDDARIAHSNIERREKLGGGKPGSASSGDDSDEEDVEEEKKQEAAVGEKTKNEGVAEKVEEEDSDDDEESDDDEDSDSDDEDDSEDDEDDEE